MPTDAGLFQFTERDSHCFGNLRTNESFRLDGQLIKVTTETEKRKSRLQKRQLVKNPRRMALRLLQVVVLLP